VVAKWTLDLIASLMPQDGGTLIAFSLSPTMLMFAAAQALSPASRSGCSPRCTARVPISPRR
jgi:hypothetical protein